MCKTQDLSFTKKLSTHDDPKPKYTSFVYALKVNAAVPRTTLRHHNKNHLFNFETDSTNLFSGDEWKSIT